MKENSIEEDIKIIEKYLSHFKKVCSPEMLKKLETLYDLYDLIKANLVVKE